VRGHGERRAVLSREGAAAPERRRGDAENRWPAGPHPQLRDAADDGRMVPAGRGASGGRAPAGTGSGDGTASPGRRGVTPRGGGWGAGAAGDGERGRGG